MNRNLIILRGVSGSGKTTFCDLIGGNKIVCCADDFFLGPHGNYIFDITKLGFAHKWCQQRFDKALLNEKIDTIVIANTNTKTGEWSYYEERALEAGLTVTFVVLENRHGNGSIHNVPIETLERQENTIRQNLKLR